MMMSEALTKARKYEEEKEKLIPDSQRPLLHVTPRAGWLNDPNGFSYYKGKYHLFYQYNPYSENWGPMHWGHAVSTDLLHWENLPCALAPDSPYDNSAGCFSGGAIELPDGRHLLMYTGVYKQKQEDGTEVELQVQNIALSEDGVNYEKYAGNPVLTEKDLPEGASRIDFRDPKIWRDEDGTYWCVLCSRPADGSGQILLYRSDDAFKWEYVSKLAENGNRYGKIWECPDFFELDGKHVLMTSPQDMMADGKEWYSGNNNVCIIGTYDKEAHKLIEEEIHPIDAGIDFYATQSLESPDGRRIMLAWMQNWDTCGYRPYDWKWYGQVTIPRELHIRDGRLVQQPIREIEALRTDAVVVKDAVIVNDKSAFEGVEGRTADMVIEADVTDCRRFTINLAENEKFVTKLIFDKEDGTLTFDRRVSGVRRAIDNCRTCSIDVKENKLKLRIILDRFSAEVFVGNGETTMTNVVFTEQDAAGISFEAKGKVGLNVEKYSIQM